MYANKFAEGYANMRLEDGHRRVARTPSPRDVAASSSSQHIACPVGAGGEADDADCLASRISFYMDDAVISSTDEVRDVSPALSRQASSRQQQQQQQQPRGLHPHKAPSSHARRSRSFRLETHEEPRPRLYRHGSDIGPGGARRSSARSKRSGGGRRAGGAGGSGGTTPERGGSVRSAGHHHHHHRSGSGRRKTSSASRLCVPHAAAAAAAAAAQRRSSFPLPHADLPPKERRRRLVVLIVVVTFMFLVVCSVLTVVVTLTHSSFQKSPPDSLRSQMPETEGPGDFDLPEPETSIFRKENEELMSAITRGGMYNNSAASSTPLEVSSTPDP